LEEPRASSPTFNIPPRPSSILWYWGTAGQIRSPLEFRPWLVGDFDLQATQFFPRTFFCFVVYHFGVFLFGDWFFGKRSRLINLLVFFPFFPHPFGFPEMFLPYLLARIDPFPLLFCRNFSAWFPPAVRLLDLLAYLCPGSSRGRFLSVSLWQWKLAGGMQWGNRATSYCVHSQLVLRTPGFYVSGVGFPCPAFPRCVIHCFPVPGANVCASYGIILSHWIFWREG